jgi:autotransporter passenger strand-loop-strand repeat protein
MSAGTVIAGGELIVQRTGLASATQVSGRGATMLVQNGGSASGTLVGSGGLLDVLAGGTDVAAVVGSGAREIVGGGGVTSGTMISGGVVEIARGGSVGSGTVTFAASGGGMLQLDDAQNFGGLVAGFGQPGLIDLRDIAFGSGTTLSFTEAPGNTSGTLSVSDGVHSANIMLIGQYTTAQFTKASDAHGGTLIGDPPVATQSDPQAIGLISPHQT